MSLNDARDRGRSQAFSPGLVQRKSSDVAGPGKRTLTEQLPADGAPGAAAGVPGASQGIAPADGTAHRTVSSGSSGPDVKLAQARLNEHGATPALVEDGMFGPKTRGATLAFQNVSGLAADGIIGPRTWAALDLPASHSHGKGAATGGPHKNVFYDTGGHVITPPPPGTTLAKVQADVAALKQAKPPDITDAKVSGVTANTDEEIFVLDVIAKLGKADRWGTEVDLQTAIGFPPKGGGKAPMGLVTLRIDPAGKASAELLKGATVSGPTSFATFADGEKKLLADFKFSEVKNGGASWSPVELGKVHAALSILGGPEKAALSGVSLVREHTLALPDGTPVDGLFNYSAGLDASGAATRAESLSIADGAFASDSMGFIGNASKASPLSFETIIHEAGHAVETKAFRDAQFDRLSAEVQSNQDFAVFTQANSDTAAAVAAFNTAKTAAFALAGTYKPADQTSAKAFFAAVNAATKALSAFIAPSTSTGIAKLETAAVAAVTARGAERTKLTTASSKHPALTDFVATEAAQDKWLAAAQTRAKALTTLDASKAKVTTARATEKATKGTGGHSKRLSNFVTFVNANKIEPFTDYAQKNWPGTPDEFFAEAFSIFNTDPDFLQTNYKPLFDWFAKGEHLK